MKKIFLLLTYCCLAVFSSPFAAIAQESIETPSLPLERIKNFIEAPPQDILKKSLEQAKESSAKNENESEKSLRISEIQTDISDQIDPFTPQIPQEAKILPNIEQVVTPTTPNTIAEQAAPIPQFIVSGMVWNSKKLTAIVNDQIVSIGDQVSNWTVSAITKDGINMTFDQQNLWIKPIVNPELEAQGQPTNSFRR